jgi:hypothetical protein
MKVVILSPHLLLLRFSYQKPETGEACSIQGNEKYALTFSPKFTTKTKLKYHDSVKWTKLNVDICVKTNKCTNYSFNLLIIYGNSYTFRHYIAILREHC